MNQNVEDYYRGTLKEKLAECTEGQQLLFKRIYSHGQLELPIWRVVDNMEVANLDNALDQVERTLVKKEAKEVQDDRKNGNMAS